MKRKTILPLLLCSALLLGACGSTSGGSQGTSSDNGKTAEVSETTEASETDEDSEAVEDSEKTDSSESDPSSADSGVHLSIDGYDSEHFPNLDGSLANQPLLLRIMSELTGADDDTVETYFADSFENGGTSTSWGKLIYESMDLIISYEPPQEVKDAYEAEFEDLEIDPLGRDGLVFIVNVNNPIESLTIDQIRDIYTGKITDWSEVGGEPGEIQAFQRNSTSGSQTLLNKLVMDGEETMEPDEDLLIGTMGELIERVAAFDGSGSAIGFSVYYYADRMKSDPNLKMIQVEGITPSNETIEDGSYPLCNDFYMAIRASADKDSPVRALRDWLLSDDGRALLEEEGYVWARTGMEAVSNGAGNPFR